MAQETSNVRSFQELSQKYAERIGSKARKGVIRVQKRVDDLASSRELNDRIKTLKTELAEFTQRSQGLMADLSNLSEKVSRDLKRKLSRS